MNATMPSAHCCLNFGCQNPEVCDNEIGVPCGWSGTREEFSHVVSNAPTDVAPRPITLAKGGPTEGDPDRPYCKPDQSCGDFCCGN